MNYCELGIEIETPTWLFLLVILFFISMLILWFIATIKSIKAYRERTNKNKPKEDGLQKLLNLINERIIWLEGMRNIDKEKDYYWLGSRSKLEEIKSLIIEIMEEKKNDKQSVNRRRNV